MSKATCQTIQSELDLLMLGESHSADATAHLRECAACREFQQKQTKLREIVGSLGTVPAPADFDFRLRARLANERPGLPVQASWLFGQRAVAAGSALVLVFAIVAFVAYKSKPGSQVAEGPKPVETVAVTPPPAPIENGNNVKSQEVNSGIQRTKGSEDEVIVKNPSKNKAPKRQLASADFSSTQATVVKDSNLVEPSDSIFSVEASQQPYRVSLYDGRGKARTISVPPVSFGSQRAIPTSTSYAPKGIW